MALENILRKGENADNEGKPGSFFSSTGQRPASYSHGVVSVVCPSVQACVRL